MSYSSGSRTSTLCRHRRGRIAKKDAPGSIELNSSFDLALHDDECVSVKGFSDGHLGRAAVSVHKALLLNVSEVAQSEDLDGLELAQET